MRLTEVMEHEVVDQTGRRWGRVHDARLVQDGPVLASGYAAFRLHALVAGRAGFGTRLGYVGGDASSRGPWAIRVVVRWLHRRAVLIPWDAVREVTAAQVLVDAPPDGFRPAGDAA